MTMKYITVKLTEDQVTMIMEWLGNRSNYNTEAEMAFGWRIIKLLAKAKT